MSKLNLHLPPPYPGELYQLVHLGKIGKHSYNPNTIDITAYFQKKHDKDGFTRLWNGPVERKVDLRHVTELQVGALYTAEGIRVLDSAKVVTSTIEVTLGARAQTVLPLKEVLPGFSSINDFISEQLWHRIEEATYIIIDVEGMRIALPCIEFIKYFFYRGPGIINFLCSHCGISAICELFAPPTESNMFTAKLIVHENQLTKRIRFSRDEVKVIAELSINQSYRRNIYSSQTKLLCQWNNLYNRQSLEPRAYFINDGSIGKDVKFKFNGTLINCHSRNAGKPVFLVASIVSCQTNFFSYRHLLFHLPVYKARSFFQGLSPGEGWSSIKPGDRTIQR